MVCEWGAGGAVGARTSLLSARLTSRRPRKIVGRVLSHSRGAPAVRLLRQLPIFQHSIATARNAPERPPHRDGMSSAPVATAACIIPIRMLDVEPLLRGADRLGEVCATSAASHISCKAAACWEHVGDVGCPQMVAELQCNIVALRFPALRAAPAASMAGCGGGAVGRPGASIRPSWRRGRLCAHADGRSRRSAARGGTV